MQRIMSEQRGYNASGSFLLVFALRDLNEKTFRVRVILRAAALMYDIFHSSSCSEQVH